MYTFGQLCIGDLFNTKAARWVKVSAEGAVCVMSTSNVIGKIVAFYGGADVTPLYSSLLPNDGACGACKPAVPQSLSESEKEDRFYRKIEAEIDAENRERQAAEFKQSLIDERDALNARCAGLVDYQKSDSLRNDESYWAAEQYNAMCRYSVALQARIYLLDQPAKQIV